uniref:Clathrin/coatomer adaptor adaptin-like N-terminal domain-containing protein n=1 Tax=Picocystis salinarum TaxID=88271 RepID=A0A7S3UCP7_9CHLO
MASVSAVATRVGKTLAFSREFTDLVRAIGECKSKQEEDGIVEREAANLKARLAQPKLDQSKIKEYIVRLMYVEMLGHDASFGYVFAVKATHENNLMAKKVGYLASAIFLNDDDELIFLMINTIQNDLRSDNLLVVCAALDTICNLCSEDAVPAILPLVLDLLKHPKEIVRKKAVLALHRMHETSPYVEDCLDHFQEVLCDKDPSVMSAAICALHSLVAADSLAYKGLTTSFVTILKQVASGRLPKTFDYHKSPAPFIQIRILKVLALLGANDRQCSSLIYPVLADVLRGTNGSTTISNSILYECVKTITCIYPNPQLLSSAEEVTSRLLKSGSSNLRYVGVSAMICIIQVDSAFVEQHQMTVIDCLEDPDDSLRKKTLELLEKMTSPDNVDVIVERMLEFLHGITDEVVKRDIVSRVSALVERFSPDDSWFLSTMNRIFEVGGEEVEDVLAHNLIHLIAEGGGDGNDELRKIAVRSYVELLQKAELPAVMLKVISWVLGEFAVTYSELSHTQVIDMLCDIGFRKPHDEDLLCYITTGIMKVCAHGGPGLLSSQAEAVVTKIAGAQSTLLSQIAHELQTFLTFPAEAFQAICPSGGSSQRMQSLEFAQMDKFVEEQIVMGSDIDQVQQERVEIKQRTTPTSKPKLKVEAYQRPERIASTAVAVNQEDTFAMQPPQFQEQEPKLALNPRRRRWGQHTAGTYQSEPVTQQGSRAGREEGGNNSVEYASQSTVEDTLPSQRQQLAASLFGARNKRNTLPHSGVELDGSTAGVQNPVSAPVEPLGNLLDLDAPTEQTVQNPADDIFSQLETLSIGDPRNSTGSVEGGGPPYEASTAGGAGHGIDLLMGDFQADNASEHDAPTRLHHESSEVLVASEGNTNLFGSGNHTATDLFSLQSQSSIPLEAQKNKSLAPSKPGAMRPGKGPALAEKKDPFQDLLG